MCRCPLGLRLEGVEVDGFCRSRASSPPPNPPSRPGVRQLVRTANSYGPMLNSVHH